MILVVDASVAIKWFFASAPDESDTDRALAILGGLGSGTVELIQPPHFVAEVAAVLARKKPDEAEADLQDLLGLGFGTRESMEIYATAIELSIRLDHHLFDTLYHATALHHPGATLVTADLRYYEKAKGLGQVVLLTDVTLPE